MIILSLEKFVIYFFRILNFYVAHTMSLTIYWINFTKTSISQFRHEKKFSLNICLTLVYEKK
jgi:hypothetical protein